jgi:hypothetical protein
MLQVQTTEAAKDAFLDRLSTRLKNLYCVVVIISIANVIERRGRVVNSPASYSRGPMLKSRSGDRLS